MDKINQYSNLVKSLLQNYTDLACRYPVEYLETHAIFDDERKRYMVLDIGWSDKDRLHKPTLYVRLDNDKIWIEEDWTENGVATDLLAAGVPKEDIVLAFHHPKIRPLTEFAIA
ncbi:MAG: XisI protein [Anaerolineaceae bacterium 4572_78]|nr:MAG: XisI protein [Anaerolineaceae bacterium 4572_78]